MTQQDQDIRSRRREQFAQYLRLMRKRMRGVRSGVYFLVISASSDKSVDGRPTISTELNTAVFATKYGDSSAYSCDPGRFVQFAFEPDSFVIDLPNVTLSRAEAAELLECRPGFYFLNRQSGSENSEAELSEWDPLQRIYEYGDEATAADDMAFVWFELWRFPPDWRFYVTAAAFEGPTKWERDKPLDVNSGVPTD